MKLCLRNKPTMKASRRPWVAIPLALTLVLTLLSTPASAAAFVSGPGRSWSISAQAPGGGPVAPGAPLEVVVTMTWDSPMHDYVGPSCTLKGSTSDPRVPSMYFSSPSASPTSLLFPSCGSTHQLSDDFMTATWTTTITAPSTVGNYQVTAYSRGGPYFDDNFYFSYSVPFAYTVTTSTVPDAPTSVNATAGDTDAAISWTTPANDGGATITGYTATASPGGNNCTTTTNGCTITGLTNGTAYTFTAVATNTNGNSPTSTSSTTVTPSAPPVTTTTTVPTTTVPTTTVPTTTAPTTTVPITTVPTPASTTPPAAHPSHAPAPSDDSAAAGVDGTDTSAPKPTPPVTPSTGATAPVAVSVSVDRTDPEAGDDLMVAGDGFSADSSAEIWLYPDEILLGTVTNDGTGAFEATFTLPAGINGDREIRVVGADQMGEIRTEVLGIQIRAAMSAVDTGSAPAGAYAARSVAGLSAPQATNSNSNSLLWSALLVIAAGGILTVAKIRRNDTSVEGS
jgi:fibronectin type III domain protein